MLNNLNLDILDEIYKYIYYPQNPLLLEDLRSYVFVKKNLIKYYDLHNILWILLLYNNNTNLYIKLLKIPYNNISGRVSWTKKYEIILKKNISIQLKKISPKKRYHILNQISEIKINNI